MIKQLKNIKTFSGEIPKLLKKTEPRHYFIGGSTILIVIVYVIFRSTLLNASGSLQFFQILIELYKNSLLFISENLIRAFGIKVRYFPEFNYLISGREAIVIGYPFLALKQSFVILISTLLLEKAWKRKIIWGISGMGLLFLINIFRLSSIHLVCIDYNIIHAFYRSVIWIGFFYYLHTRLEKHSSLGLPYQRFKTYINEKLIINVGNLIILYFSKSFLILTYQAIFPKEVLINIILKQSAYFIKLFGADPVIEGRYIFIRRTWVYLGDPCLGIMLILTFLSLFLILKAKLVNKLIWMLAGVIIIITINSVRIAAISFHLQQHGGKFNPAIDPHDLYSYMVYGAVFLIWVVFIKWGRGRL